MRPGHREHLERPHQVEHFGVVERDDPHPSRHDTTKEPLINVPFVA